nr:hypothetical protein OG781_17210 [Streptomyces sp. NBC_00830]
MTDEFEHEHGFPPGTNEVRPADHDDQATARMLAQVRFAPDRGDSGRTPSIERSSGTRLRGPAIADLTDSHSAPINQRELADGVHTARARPASYERARPFLIKIIG